MSNYLIVIPTCIFVKGFSRSAIYDTQREVIDFIPNDLYDFCLKSNKRTYHHLLILLKQQDIDIYRVPVVYRPDIFIIVMPVNTIILK
jgi:hypothetical protein